MYSMNENLAQLFENVLKDMLLDTVALSFIFCNTFGFYR